MFTEYERYELQSNEASSVHLNVEIRLRSSSTVNIVGYNMVQFSSVQFSPLTDWVIGGTRETAQLRSSSSLSCRPL